MRQVFNAVKIPKDAGFSLPELIIVLGILVVSGTLLTGILINHSGISIRQTSIVEEGLQINDVLREIESIVKQATAISESYTTVNDFTYTSDASTLVLKLHPITSTWSSTENFDYAVIAIDEDYPNLARLMVFPDPESLRSAQTRVLSSSIDSLTFTYLDKNGNPVEDITTSSQVQTELQINIKSGTARTGSTKTFLRNNSI